MSRSAKQDWMPPHSVRENARAKQVILRMIPGTGLLVTVPRGFDHTRLTDVFKHHRRWIEQQLLQNSRHASSIREIQLPGTIHLTAIDETWWVTSRHQPGARPSMIWQLHPAKSIELQGDLGRKSDCCWLLKDWLKNQARRALIPWVGELSDQTGLGVRRCQVRTQKTRWGSCSARGTLSLNAALLFLRRDLVRYVIVHELCHTIHAGHPPAFWQEVERLENNYRRLDAELKAAATKVPRWVHG